MGGRVSGLVSPLFRLATSHSRLSALNTAIMDAIRARRSNLPLPWASCAGLYL